MKQKVLKEEVDQILSQAFWQKGGVRITENTEVTQDQEVAQDEQVDQQEQIEEAAEGHVCPLCESQLQEAISDEQLAEHVDFMVSVISEMEDITDEDLDGLAEEIVADDSEEEDLDEAKKKPAFLEKLMKGKKKG